MRPEDIYNGKKVHPSRRNLRLAGLLTDAVDRYTQGTLLPCHLNEPSESDFSNDNDVSPDLCVYKCPGCQLMNTRTELIKHMEDSHPELLKNHVCTVCMIKVNDMDKHKTVHEKAMSMASLNMATVSHFLFLNNIEHINFQWSMGRSILGCEQEFESRDEDTDIIDFYLKKLQEISGNIVDTVQNSQLSTAETDIVSQEC